MITIKETIRTMLLVILPGLWMSSSVSALASSASTEAQNPMYRIRRRAASSTTSEAISEQRRELNQFLPNFSGDENLVKAKMPDLTLALNGLTGRPLGEKSYSAMQTAMNDYLRKRFEDYFLPRYQFVDVETEVVDDVPLEAFELSGGNAISMETTLMFHDPSGDSESVETEIAETFGARTRQRVQPPETFRQSDGVSATVNPDAVPSALALELAAGYAWNDLSSFRNHLLVAATIDNLETFNGMGDIESIEGFTTNAQTADEIAVAEEEQEQDTTEEEVVAQPPDRGDVSSPSGSGLNVAAATAGIQQSGTNRMNPLWPALIVGLGVFLFTIIFLGYRRHKASRVANLTDKPDNIMIHISSKESVSIADAGEIEVEDTIFSTPDRKQRRKNKERDLDKEYAKSCMKPVNMSRSSTLNSSFDDEPDENDETEGRKGCFPRRSKRVSLSEQDSMALSTSNNDGRKVDLTSPTNSSSWRNPAGLQEEEAVDTGDMSKKEKKRFSKYMEAGLTLEEASSQIMRERNQKSRRWLRGDKLPTSPSAMAGTRSGDYGGYHPSNSHRGQRTASGQSSAMDCISPCAEESLHSELMEDGTAVHYVKKPAYMSLGAACAAEDPSMLDGIRDESEHNKKGSRKINGTARAMVITEASSYGADSYDDEDFDRSMEEAAMGSI